jgi:predicted nucleotide-binding protein (sugar kinase/HSP70/actin superfamily)
VLGTEAVLTMGRVLDLARHGIAGVINVLPFSCMPGTVVSCMAPRLREEMHGVPWLDVAFDGQEETNLHTRLEAFMHQSFQYHRRALKAS